MKPLRLLFVILSCIIFCSCQNSYHDHLKTVSDDPDPRSRAEVSFLNRIKSESDYDVTSNAVNKDSHIKVFNEYAIDSLKKITNWEMIVTEVNDNKFAANSFAGNVLDLGNNECYNLILVAPIKIDKSVDSIAIDNRVDFTATILKEPKNDKVEKQLSLIKTLTKGDTVIVSGSLTHIDANLKVNFASFYDQYGPWNIDLLLLDIRKKSK